MSEHDEWEAAVAEHLKGWLPGFRKRSRERRSYATSMEWEAKARAIEEECEWNAKKWDKEYGSLPAFWEVASPEGRALIVEEWRQGTIESPKLRNFLAHIMA
jgi:hypothetical protein